MIKDHQNNNHSYTSNIPNVLFDYWMSLITPAEFKVLMCLGRNFENQIKHQYLSFKDIEEISGLSKKGILNSLNSLITKELIFKNDLFKPHRYLLSVTALNVDCLNKVEKPLSQIEIKEMN